MKRAGSIFSAAVALLFAAPVLAAPELAVAPFGGAGGATVRTQVVRAVCGELVDCSAPLPKGKSKKSAPVLSGKVTKGKRATTLDLSLVMSGRDKWRKSYPLVGGKLGQENLEKIASAVHDALGVQPPAPEPTPPVVAEPTPAPAWATEPSTPAEPASEASNETQSARTGGYVPATIYASINVDMLSRSFSLSELTSQNLHDYQGFPIATPHLHIDAYPLARLMDGWLTGLGLEFDFSFTMGLKSVLKNEAGAETAYPSQLMHVAAALKFRVPLTSSGIAVVPAVGFNRTSFSVSSAEDGSSLSALPQVAYTGLRVGLGAEAPLLSDKLLLGLNVAYLPVFSAGDVISSAYFPAGTVWGIAVNAGASYRVLTPLEIRLAFSMERYGMTFETIPGDTYLAAGASDLLMAVTLGVGYVF
ncbi:MAG: hypothetical protein HY901_29805 [Deltaproteobacteria bacterium]|nr:hypothetical protein [Deltaproteobacteria bacterium]